MKYLLQEEIDYVRWVLINQNNLLIYPPDYKENIHLATIARKSRLCNSDLSNFPECIKITIFFADHQPKFMPIFSEASFDNVRTDVCHVVPFLDDIYTFERGTNYPILCAEVNFEKLMRSNLQCNSETIKVFALSNSDLKYMKYIPSNETNEQNIPVFYGDDTVTAEVLLKTYKDKIFDEFILKDDSEIKVFHLMYLDIFNKYPISKLK